MRLGIIGGSSLTTFDPKDAFGVLGLESTERAEIVATTEYGEVHLTKYELGGAATYMSEALESDINLYI